MAHALHVVDPFDVPDEWRRVAGIDYGYAAPWAVEWIAQDGTAACGCTPSCTGRV
jgi:hypothetical protein